MNALRLGIKFTLGFGAILLLTLVLGVTGYRALTTIATESTDIASRLVPQLELSTRIQKSLNQTEMLFSRYIRSSEEKDASAVIASLDTLDQAFQKLRVLSIAEPELTSLESFVRGSGSLLKSYAESIHNAITIQKNLITYQNTMNVAAASLERGSAGLSGSFMADIFGKMEEGGDELRELIAGQYSVNALQTQIQTMRREVQQAILNRSPNEVTVQIRRIPDLQFRFERLEQSIKHAERKQILADAKQDLQAYLADLARVHDGFVAQTEAIERQSTIYASLLDVTEKLATQSTVNISKTTETAAQNTTTTTEQMFVILVVTALLTCLIAVMTTRAITVPIKQGVAFATEVANGNFKARWETSRQDEIGKLALSLNTAFSKVTDKVHWFEGVLNSVPFSLSVTDLDMNWTFMNTFGLKSIGRTSVQDILGHHCSEKAGDLCNTPNCGIASLRRGNPVVKFKSPTGNSMQVLLNYLSDSNGNHIGHVEIGQDITVEENLRVEAASALERGRHETAIGLEGVVETLSSASMSLSSQIEQCNRGAESASAQLTGAASAMEEMNSTVLEVARNSATAAEMSLQARTLAQEGSQDADMVMLRMSELHKTSLGIKTDMQELGQQAEAITQIMRVISDIADQTNLLALNAAIEAARAGEAGRGFAVVADEVRKLAEKTMSSTGNVARAIEAIQEGTRKNIANVDMTAQQIEEMTGLTKKSDQSLAQIVSIVDTTSDQIRTIATASEQQAATSEEINNALARINAIALESVTAMKAANVSVKQLVSQSDILRAHIDKLKS